MEEGGGGRGGGGGERKKDGTEVRRGRHGGRMLLRENVEKPNVRAQKVGKNVKEREREEKV